MFILCWIKNNIKGHHFFFGGASDINLGFLEDRFCSLVLAAWTIDLFGHCGREPQR